ncbi:MAG: methyltransferase domain-containing protein [Planctomycetota bacterium]|jgi:SAM-dependent methyltransferase
MDDYYEQEKTLHEYLAFHYPAGDPLEAILGAAAPPIEMRFPFALSRLWDRKPDGLALDVGAACGRMTFELARDHKWAVGLDLAKALVRGARQVRESGRARYRTQREGDLLDEHDVAVDAPRNTGFLVGSALDLPFADRMFETVIALNLLDRVPDPARALDELARVTKGSLFVSSPYTWLEEFTPRERWLGGFVRNGDPVRGIETVRERFANEFTIVDERRLPFFIPHHARSGQIAISCLIHLRRNS